jgi:hypothetical protein
MDCYTILVSDTSLEAQQLLRYTNPNLQVTIFENCPTTPIQIQVGIMVLQFKILWPFGSVTNHILQHGF